MKKRKICVVTSTRADYGLLFWVLKNLQRSDYATLQLVVTGSHLSPAHGLTYLQIENDGFTIAKKLDILLSSDSPSGITKSIGLANIAFADAFEDIKPEIVLVLGDRFEILAATTAALVARIPIAHCHGGELTAGAMDDSFRHAITKMAHIHFTATTFYRDRVIQLGEQPNTVHNVGALGIENIRRLRLLTKIEFEESIGFKLRSKNLLITFHPVTLENGTAQNQFNELLDVLEDLEDTGLIFTMPNADTDSSVIMESISKFVKDHVGTAVAFESLGQLRYLSALKHVDGVVGNSSSGIIEAPSLGAATINIGDRQLGRIKAASIIDCHPEKLSIQNALERLYDVKFRASLKDVVNPYDQGDSSDKICEVLMSVNLEGLLKKSFFDCPTDIN